MDPELFASIMKDVEQIVGEERRREVEGTKGEKNGMQTMGEMNGSRAQ